MGTSLVVTPVTMSLTYLRTNLHYISQTPTDCSLVSYEGVPIPTQQLLLAAASSYLASLLAQSGTTATTITLPFTTKVVRRIIQVLGEEEGDTIETEAFLAAREMGIMFLKEKVGPPTAINVKLKKETFVFSDDESHEESLGKMNLNQWSENLLKQNVEVNPVLDNTNKKEVDMKPKKKYKKKKIE